MELLDQWVTGLEDQEAGRSPTVTDADRQKNEAAAVVTQQKMEKLAPADQAAAIDKMNKDEFSAWVKNLPAAEKDRLGPMLDQTASPDKKLIMWGESYKGEAADMAAAAHAELNAPGTSPERIKELTRVIEAANKDMSEADQEVAAMAGEWGRAGGTVGLNDLEDMRARKGREMDLEKGRGINITNETASIAEAKAGGKARWSEDDLNALDGELEKIPEHVRSYIPEYHRAHGPGGGMWDGNRLNCYNQNPGVWRHEMSHAIDSADDVGKAEGTSASERYKKNNKYQAYDTDDALKAGLRGKVPEAELEAKVQELKNAPHEGEYGTQAIEIDGVIYQANQYRRQKDDGTWETYVGYSSYDARRIPRRGKGEKDEQDDEGGTRTTNWDDVYEHARWAKQNPSHFYEEHVNNALADPVRIHSDFVNRPQADVKRLEEDIATRRAAGEDVTAAEKELDEAEKTRDAMREQYDLVRESLGVDTASIDAAAAGLSPAEREAFLKQADRVSSAAQLKKLRQTWADGTAIGTQNVVNRMETLRKQGFSEDYVRAYYEDAKNCFTREQLDHMTKMYAEQKRTYGEWDPKKVKRGEQSCGY